MSFAHPVVISAAGIGSRLGLNRPKCLVEIEGKPLIHHQLNAVRDCPDVRVVVGFQEREVIRATREFREDVIFVRNPRYQTTSNLHSLLLGTLGSERPVISLDGDLLISYGAFERFRDAANRWANLVAVTERATDEAVSVSLSVDESEVVGFYNPGRPQDLFEWAGLALIDAPDVNTKGFIFRQIEKRLPVPCVKIECYEIDTEADLTRAREVAQLYLKEA